MNANRRTFIRTAGLVTIAGLAGCLGTTGVPSGGGTPTTDGGEDTGDENGSGLPGSDDGNDGPGGETRLEGTGGPGISLQGTDATPDLPVRPTVEITRDTATADHPPQVRVTITNESDDLVRIGEGRAAFFEYVADDDRQLTFLPADGEYPAEPDCWRLEEPIFTTEEYRIVDVPAGESVSRLVDLYGTPGEDACLPVGNFRFETTISVTGDPDAVPDAGKGADWGFTLTLE